MVVSFGPTGDDGWVVIRLPASDPRRLLAVAAWAGVESWADLTIDDVPVHIPEEDWEPLRQQVCDVLTALGGQEA